MEQIAPSLAEADSDIQRETLRGVTTVKITIMADVTEGVT